MRAVINGTLLTPSVTPRESRDASPGQIFSDSAGRLFLALLILTEQVLTRLQNSALASL